ncbi:hypothetical protein KSD_88170 [Ktedonobacter sp. SOSP1-85]|uniref:hypothetical protein n=1 Tax=Ktedonobacter sp. SOSP1-85 TaxID=2778367 RepID=UPI0019157C44|nr:hypothetical protein [Ktedonobacter sp. SOSP1-85]GHO81046.1 hypothetical protein KSD_88170 [Ktedonobacter sp. SOSP1-85]
MKLSLFLLRMSVAQDKIAIQRFFSISSALPQCALSLIVYNTAHNEERLSMSNPKMTNLKPGKHEEDRGKKDAFNTA